MPPVGILLCYFGLHDWVHARSGWGCTRCETFSRSRRVWVTYEAFEADYDAGKVLPR